LGGLEKVGFKIQTIEIDIDNNGIIDKDELEKSREHCLKMIEAFQSQLLNYGVICGLYFTVLFPIALSPIVVSNNSQIFFDTIIINIFTYIYYCCIYISLIQSLLMVYKASRYYLHLTLWMPNIELKYWYINTVPIQTFIFTSNRIIKFVILSLPFGIAVGVSPISGLISFFLAINFMWENTKISFIDTKVCMKVHDYVSKFFSVKLKKNKN